MSSDVTLSADALLAADTSIAADTRILADSAAQTPSPFEGTDPQLILVDGQSLSVGTDGTPPLTTVNSYGAPQPENADSFNALVEASVERPVTAGVFQARDTDTTRLYLSTSQGVSGQAIAALRAPSTHWTNVQNKLGAVDAQEALVALRCVPWVQGNSDAASATGYYSAQLALLQAEYTTEAQARLGGQGAQEVVLLLCQPANVTQPLTTADQSEVPYEMFAAWEADPTRFILVGPMYQWSDAAADHVNADGVHLVNTGYRLLAELWGESLLQTFVAGTPWSPLHITSAVFAGSDVVITFSEDFDVDTTACIAAPSAGPTLWGVYLLDPSPRPAVIQSISQTANNQLTAVCSGQPHTGAQIITGWESRRGAFAGPGIVAASLGSARTNLRATAVAGVGVESGENIVKWAALQKHTVTGTQVTAASDGTCTLDRRWSGAWASQAGVPGAGAWSNLVGGLDLPLLSGTNTGGQDTTGLADAAIGSTLVDQAFDSDGSSVYRVTDAGDLALFDMAAGEKFLFRFMGDLQRPGANAYMYHRGIFTGDRLIILATSAGNVSVTLATGLGTRTAAASAVLPVGSTLGILDVCIDLDFAGRLRVHIAVNGAVVTSSVSAFGIGACATGDMTLFAASNGSAPWASGLNSFVGVALGHDASWWTPEAHALDAAAI